MWTHASDTPHFDCGLTQPKPMNIFLLEVFPPEYFPVLVRPWSWVWRAPVLWGIWFIIEFSQWYRQMKLLWLCYPFFSLSTRFAWYAENLSAKVSSIESWFPFIKLAPSSTALFLFALPWRWWKSVVENLLSDLWQEWRNIVENKSPIFTQKNNNLWVKALYTLDCSFLSNTMLTSGATSLKLCCWGHIVVLKIKSTNFCEAILCRAHFRSNCNIAIMPKCLESSALPALRIAEAQENTGLLP